METVYKLAGNRALKISYDNYAESPREWDNLSKLIIFGKYSHLGEKHNIDANDYSGWEENKKAVLREYDCAIILPLYAYSKGGLILSTSSFSCPWDSGQKGWVILTKEDIRECYSIKKVTKKYREKALECLNAEIEVFNQYLNGEVYYFNIENEEEDIEDSCGGFFGDNIKENGILDHLSEEDKEEVLKQIG